MDMGMGLIISGMSPSGRAASGGGASVTYLPTITGTSFLAVGAKRMVSGYSGNLYRLRRASDNATLDVACATGSDLPDYSAISTWAGGANLFVVLTYDQFTGTATPASASANQPSFDLTQALAGCVPWLWAPSTLAADTASLQPLTLQLNATMTLRDFTVFDVLDPFTSIKDNAHWAMYSGATKLALQTDTALRVGLDIAVGTASGATILPPRAQPSVIAVRSNASGTTIYQREQVLAGSGIQPTGTSASIYLGWSPAANSNYRGRMRRWGFVAYSALSDADVLAVRNNLATMFSIPITFDRRIVYAGDSIVERYSSSFGKNLLYYTVPLLNGSPEVFNMGIAGQRITQDDGAKVARFGGLYTSAYGAGRCALIEEAGINDFGAGATASSTFGVLNSIGTYAKGLGYKFGAACVMPMDNTTFVATPAAADVQRVSYNSSLAPSSSIDFVIDVTGDSHLGVFPTSPDDTTYFDDKIHPKSVGFAIMGPIWATAINAAVV